MYKRNIEARPYIYCCSGKAISITYSERLIVAFGTQHEIRIRIVIRGLPGSTILPHIFS
jgi:hypothetical protein